MFDWNQTHIKLAAVFLSALATAELPAQSTTTSRQLENQNQVLAQLSVKPKYSASSFWTSYKPDRAFDQDEETSWFSGRNDAAAFNKTPWVEIEFPQDMLVSRVTVIGNREPSWSLGYSVLCARVELYDKRGKLLARQMDDATGKQYDFDFKLVNRVGKVRKVRFVTLVDQGDQNSDRCIAVGEILVD